MNRCRGRRASRATESVTEGLELNREEAGRNQERLGRGAEAGKKGVATHPAFRRVTLVSLDAVRQYIALLWRRYQSLERREEKSVVLDELCRNLRIHRKSAIRLMTAEAVPRLRRSSASRSGVYSDWAKEHLARLWRKMGYLGSVRLKAAIPDWLPYYEECSDDIKGELLRMSARTMERLLKEEKAALQRRLNTGTRRGKLIVTQVPLRDFDFTPDTPGHMEADTVAHCGDSMSGKFVRTLTTVDLTVGWTECEAMEPLNGDNVRKALEQIEPRLPCPFLGLYTDNGMEFLNDDVINDFANKKDREVKIDMRRGRPYKKNDQARVEQKNYTHVRQAFGYDRITGRVAVKLMNDIYRNEWRLLQNYFWPQARVKSKQRIGSRRVRKMDTPKTPYQRLLDNPTVNPEVKNRLVKERESLNPFELRRGLARKLRTFARFLAIPWGSHRGKYHDDP